MSLPMMLVLLLSLSGTFLQSQVQAYPNILVDSSGGCMTDLSTDEVIMNYPVKPYEESTHPELHLVWVKNDGTRERGPVELEATELPLTVMIQLVTATPDHPPPGDIQYVVETTPGAKFTRGGGCDGKRVSGRMRNDPGVPLTITDLSLQVKVWAGWATGHEAVQLTDYLIFSLKQETTNAATTPGVEQQQQDQQVQEQPPPPSSSTIPDQEITHQQDPEQQKIRQQEEGGQQQQVQDPLELELQALSEEVEHLEEKMPSAKGGSTHKKLLQAEKEALKDLSKLKRLQDDAAMHSQGIKEALQRAHADVAQAAGAARTKKEKLPPDVGKLHDQVRDWHRESAGGKHKWKEAFKDLHPLERFYSHREKHPNGKEDTVTGNQDRAGVENDKREAAKQQTPPKSDPVTTLEALQRKYDSDKYGTGGEFDLQHFAYGAIFLVVASILVIQVCLWTGKQEKGRRNL